MSAPLGLGGSLRGSRSQRSRGIATVRDLVYLPAWELRDWLLVPEESVLLNRLALGPQHAQRSWSNTRMHRFCISEACSLGRSVYHHRDSRINNGRTKVRHWSSRWS